MKTLRWLPVLLRPPQVLFGSEEGRRWEGRDSLVQPSRRHTLFSVTLLYELMGTGQT